MLTKAEALGLKAVAAGGHSPSEMTLTSPQPPAEDSVSLERLLADLRVSRALCPGTDPRRESRRAGPEVGLGLPHRGERRAPR